MTRRQAERAADVFTAAVIASVAIALAALTWRIVAGVSSSAPAPLVAVPRGDVDVAPILAMAPFGGGAGGEAVATSLPIELRGLVSSHAAHGSTALIAPTGGAAIAYAIGQSVPGGAIVESIAMDHVILGVAGHREILGFPKPPAPEGGAAPMATAPAPTQPIVVPGTSPPLPPNGAFAASPQSILEGLGATPMPNGYRIGDGISPAYRQSGLQPGDVIEQVNGTKLGNPATDQQLLAGAVRAGNVRIDILRGDRRMTLSFPVR